MSEKKNVLTLADIQQVREMLRRPAPGELKRAFDRMGEFMEALQDKDKRRAYIDKYMTPGELEGKGDE